MTIILPGCRPEGAAGGFKRYGNRHKAWYEASLGARENSIPLRRLDRGGSSGLSAVWLRPVRLFAHGGAHSPPRTHTEYRRHLPAALTRGHPALGAVVPSFRGVTDPR